MIITNRKTVVDLKEWKAYRYLFVMLAWRDFKVRYAQTAIGLLWSVLQPLGTISILYIVFARFVQVDMQGVPPLLFVTSGMLAWSYFSFVVQNSSSSIISAQAMVKKVYFPRLFLPISKALVGLIDLGVVLLILFVLFIIFGQPITFNIIFLPVFVLISMFTALGAGLWFSALSIRYRDIQYIVPFIIQLGLYITPVSYPASFALSKLPEWATIAYFLNPVAGIIDGIRWSLFDVEPSWSHVGLSLFVAMCILVSGLWFFSRVESEIADLV